MYSLDYIWNQAKSVMAKTFEDDGDTVVFESYYKDSSLAQLDEKDAVILVDSMINKMVLSENLPFIENSLRSVIDKDVKCQIKLKQDYQDARPKEDGSADDKKTLPDNISPDYTFENFVVGPSNKEAYQAALACSVNPGRQLYNPLFIYGNSGLGKTHLLCAIGNYLKKKSPAKKLLYISADTFVKQVVLAIRDKTIEDFKAQLNSLDVLLVDDIQNLAGKEKSNDVFFNVYNDLFNSRKQIVLTSDRQPHDIKEIEDRMISRFSQGLSININSPDFETAYKILEMKIKTQLMEMKIDPPDDNIASISPEVMAYLATNYSGDIRKLEGNLNHLLFYSINFAPGAPIDMNLATEAFKGRMANKGEAKSIDMKDIISTVADYYGLTRQQLLSKNRTKNIANARHIAMYLCRKNLNASYLDIGKEFGNRDHSTVLTACDKITKLANDSENYRKAIADIETLLFK